MQIAFRAISPVVNALTYRPGVYYFICQFFEINTESLSAKHRKFAATSTGKHAGLHNRVGGLCNTHALKMRVRVVKKGGE